MYVYSLYIYNLILENIRDNISCWSVLAHQIVFLFLPCMFYFTVLAMGSAWALGPWLSLAETAETGPGPGGTLCSGSRFVLFCGSPIFPGAFGGVGSAPNCWDLEKCLASDLNSLWLQLGLLSLHLANGVECPLVQLLAHFEPECFQYLWRQVFLEGAVRSGDGSADPNYQTTVIRAIASSPCRPPFSHSDGIRAGLGAPELPL